MNIRLGDLVRWKARVAASDHMLDPKEVGVVVHKKGVHVLVQWSVGTHWSLESFVQKID